MTKCNGTVGDISASRMATMADGLLRVVPAEVLPRSEFMELPLLSDHQYSNCYVKASTHVIMSKRLQL